MPVFISFSAGVDQNTAPQLIAACALQVNQGVDEIVLVLSTPGGQVDPGIMVYNVLRALPINLTTYNVGAVNSVGNAIFLAGAQRYAAPGATFLFHGVAMEFNGKIKLEEKNLTETLEGIKVAQQKIGDIISSRTSIDPEEARALFFKQETKGTEFALKKGIIHEVKPLVIPKGVTLLQLVFDKQP
jgi:ATP-dependent Clp protease, protease subunit